MESSSKKKHEKPIRDARVIAHLKSGVTFYNQGRLEEAKFQFEKALELDSDNSSIQYLLGRCYFAMNEKEVAQPLLKKSIEGDPGNTEAYYYLGWICFERGEYQDALANFELAQRSNKEGSLTANIYSGLAATYRQLGRLEEAVQAYQAALTQEPDRADLHGFLAGIFHEQGEFQEAVRHLEKGDKDDLAVQQSLAQSYWEIRDQERAISILRDVISAYPKYSNAYNLLGYYLFELKQFDEAIQTLQHLIELSDEPDEGIIFLGSAYKEIGLLDKALETYYEALRRDPNDISILQRVGYIYEEQGDLERALSYWRQTVAIAPEDAVAHSILAHGLYLKRDYKEALREINEALHINPRIHLSHQRKGYILKALGNTREAVAEFKEAIELGQMDVLIDLAELYRETGDISKAMEALKKFIEEAAKPENNVEMNISKYIDQAQVMLNELDEE